MGKLGIFCTVARTELKEKVPDVSDEILLYINYVAKQAYHLGLGENSDYAIFVEHIKSHLNVDQQVICKICNKTIDQIVDMKRRNR